MTRTRRPEAPRESTATVNEGHRTLHRFPDGTVDDRTVQQVQAEAHRRAVADRERLRDLRVRRVRLERLAESTW